MSKTDHWMRLHIGDYLADTMHLSTLQHGIYLLLIMAYFKRRGLSDDEAELARIARISRVQFRKLAGPVLEFFERTNGKLYHARIESEIVRASGGRAVDQSSATQRWYHTEYLRGEHWLEVRELALQRAKYHCEKCGNGSSDRLPLDVHHLTYENLGHELDDDLRVLCRKCHEAAHAGDRVQ